MTANPTVFIAGAGPVGLTLANELARHGVPIRIVDKAAERTDKSKALVLWSRTLELFDDAGYAGKFLPAGMVAHGAQISTGKEVVARVSFDMLDSRYPYALMIPQSESEKGARRTARRPRRDGRAPGRTDGLRRERRQGRGHDQEGERRNRDSGRRLADRAATVRIRPCGMASASPSRARPSRATGSWPTVTFPGWNPRTEYTSSGHREGILAFFPIGSERWRVVADLGAAAEREPSPRPDAGGGPGTAVAARIARNHDVRSGLAHRLPYQRTQSEGL